MHARAYQQHAGAELVGICDLDRARAEKTAAEYGAARAVTSLNELLELGLDCVSVATPDALHVAPVIAAVEAGVHVLVEKPLATSVADCEEMIRAAEENDVALMVDWHNRWNPPVYEAWQAIRKEELGEIIHFSYRLNDTIYVPTKMLPWAGESSVLHFLGSHAIDTICWLLDDVPTQVTCRRRDGVLTGMGIPTADMYLTILDFANGATAVVENCWVLPQSAPALIDHRWEIIGTEGVLYFDTTHHRAVAKYSSRTPNGFPDVSYPDLFVTPEVHGRQLGFCVEPMYHFVECIRDGKPTLTSGQDGLLNTRILAAAEESARIGKAVPLGQEQRAGAQARSTEPRTT